MGFQLSDLADAEEIRQISYTYYFALDTGNIDLLMSVFTDDAEFDMRGAGQEVLKGADVIREYFINGQLANMNGQIHLATNHRVQLAGDDATGTVYYLVHGEAKDGSTIFAGGYHDDIYRRTPDGWRFARRISVSLVTPRLTAIGGKPTGPSD